jgi:hypothetical protein
LNNLDSSSLHPSHTNPEVELEKFKNCLPVELRLFTRSFVHEKMKVSNEKIDVLHAHGPKVPSTFSRRHSFFLSLTTATNNTMKFASSFLLLVSASLANHVAAFSAVAPTNKAAAATAAATAAVDQAPPVVVVDRSMKGIDDDVAYAFDPTTGANPALTRNNKDEVWVPQVNKQITNERSTSMLVHAACIKIEDRLQIEGRNRAFCPLFLFISAPLHSFFQPVLFAHEMIF